MTCYLVALRPKGERTDTPGLLRVVHEPKLREPLPNVWLSSYLLRPSGARQLLAYFRAHNFDLSIDRAVSTAIMSDKSNKMKVSWWSTKTFSATSRRAATRDVAKTRSSRCRRRSWPAHHRATALPYGRSGRHCPQTS
jgi:hypothetical protein